MKQTCVDLQLRAWLPLNRIAVFDGGVVVIISAILRLRCLFRCISFNILLSDILFIRWLVVWR